jgi:methionyl-tRNA formyltransferase
VTAPTRLVLVTGHTFGVRAFQGIVASPAYLDGRLSVELLIGLDPTHAAATVGYHPTEPLAAEQGVPQLSTTDGRLTSLADRIRACRPDYLLVIGWSRLVAGEVLAIPAESAAAAGRAAAPGSAGCIGMHPTPLPLGRGQAPIPWTIIKGLAETAVSVFFLEAAADTGAVIARHPLPVHPRETAASLFHRVAATHFAAGGELAAGLADRGLPALPQDPAAATVWPKRRPADGEITAAMTAAEIDALVRALLGPYPRAFLPVDGRAYEVAAVEPAGPLPAAPAAPAGPDVRPDRIRFACRDGVVDLVLAGGKAARA